MPSSPSRTVNTTTNTIDLPSEVWTYIFDLAADEHLLFQYALPTSMAQSAWFQEPSGDWALRAPQEAVGTLQHASYATKKAITLTCRRWHQLGLELLFRCLYFSRPENLLKLCYVFDSPSSLTATNATTASASVGWWTRRIQLSRDYASSDEFFTISGLDEALLSVIRRSPNLEIFIMDWPLGNTLGPLADTLAVSTSLRSLRTIQWLVPFDALPKVIWALDSLPYILSAHLDFEPPRHSGSSSDFSDAETLVVLGAAANLHLTLRYLQQLSIAGHCQEFLEQATGWSLPRLKNLSMDSGHRQTDLPDILSFLKEHGSSLICLDVNSDPELDVPAILDLCPMLETFAFNADWRITPANTNPLATPRIVNTPHLNIKNIGLHGLTQAFGVSPEDPLDPIVAYHLKRANDLNFSALNKSDFPSLRSIRALSRTLLEDLNAADGPEEGEGTERWGRWWASCAVMGVKLEDCTGGELGVLPETEEGELDEEEEVDWVFGYSDDEDEEGGGGNNGPGGGGAGDDDDNGRNGNWKRSIEPSVNRISELRQLLEECRVFRQEEESMATSYGGMSPEAAMLTSMVTGGAPGPSSIPPMMTGGVMPPMVPMMTGGMAPMAPMMTGMSSMAPMMTGMSGIPPQLSMMTGMMAGGINPMMVQGMTGFDPKLAGSGAMREMYDTMGVGPNGFGGPGVQRRPTNVAAVHASGRRVSDNFWADRAAFGVDSTSPTSGVATGTRKRGLSF